MWFRNILKCVNGNKGNSLPLMYTENETTKTISFMINKLTKAQVKKKSSNLYESNKDVKLSEAQEK